MYDTLAYKDISLDYGCCHEQQGQNHFTAKMAELSSMRYDKAMNFIG